MRDRTVNRVESWDARPFSGGFATLRDMSDANFSGVVVSGDAWLFMLNGRIVGIVDGDIDDFEDASGTMYEAPDPSLPLLFSMQERAGTTQAKYYTNDTPLEEADKTLSDANFTGYVELSENVLSGDYYLVYYGGRALPVAFVGTTNELKTGDEAYELAIDEVGVYEVIKTPVNVTQVPGARSEEAEAEADESATAAGAAAGASAATDSDAAADAASSETGGESEGAPSSGTEQEVVEEASPESATQGQPESAPERQPEPEAEPSAEAAAPGDQAADRDDTVVEAAEPTEAAESGESAPAESPSPASDTATDSSTGAGSTAAGQTEESSAGDDSSVFSEEEQWRQTKSIPSLSPSEREKRRSQQGTDVASAEQQTKRPRSEQPEGASESSRQESSGSGSEESQAAASVESSQQTRAEQATTDSTESEDSTPETSGAASESPTGSPSNQQTGATETSEAANQRIAELQSRLERVDAERDELEDDLDSTRSERDQLQKRVRQLENALEEAGGDATSGPSLTPDEALAGTNLFVRYGSRGAPTLDDLTGKHPDAEAINKNLRIDHHTQFESTEAVVDGAPFEHFLEQASAFRFVSWLVRDLPYEVLDAGHRGSLGDLYEVIPEIDRAELQGVVDVETEDGNERREFDIVLRDRMGNPLVVAELNDERDPVSGDEMESLIESAQVVGDGADDLGAAFYVTASFFEPDALENAAEATETGGILSRSDRASYVKLARKHGFHLCLAEDRNDTFHLTVPEL